MRAFGRYAIGFMLTVSAASVASAQVNGAGPKRPPVDAKNDENPIEAEGYIKPPEALARLIAAPRSLNWTWGAPSPTRKYLLHALTEEPTLEFLGKKHYNLGGWQVDPVASRNRTMTFRNTSGYELLDWAAGKTIKIELPPGARGSTFTSWSPDGMTFAYFAQFADATTIYLADPATGKSRPLTKTNVAAANVQNFEWTADGKSIIAVLVPDNRGPEPKEPVIADAVRVRVNENNKLKTRNYADLIETPFEKKLFEYYNIGQLALVDVKTGKVTKVGEPDMIQRMDPSPDGKYFRITYLDTPFSYILPVSSFGTHEVIIDGTGAVLKQLAKRELSEGTSTDIVDPNDPNGGGGGGGRGGRGGGAGADSAKRNLSWHPFESGLVFFRSGAKDSVTRARDDSVARVRAARGGAGAGGGRGAPAAGGGRGGADTTAAPVLRTDTMFLWMPPFNKSASPEFKPLYVTPGKGTISNVAYSENGRIMFVTESDSGTGAHTDAIFLDENNARFVIVRGGGGGGGGGGRGAGGGGGRGGAPAGGGGALLTKTGNRGQSVVMMSADNKYVYTTVAAPTPGGRGGRGGRGAGGAAADSNAAPPKPFIDRIEIKTGARSRVYETTVTDLTESGATPLTDDITKAIVTRQSTKQPAESYLVDVATKNATKLTTAKDYWPEITNTIRKTVMAKRPDGVNIRIRVTLPPDWKAGTRLPALFWFYPSEFDNAAEYTASLNAGGGGRGGNPTGPGTFQPPGQRTMSFITAAGYALVENDSPIIATEGKLPNDNYTTDLRWNLEATVNALVDSGFVDRNKLAIGGHSYGAFSTMNAMTLTTLFKAGIAGDGMYNRTLTPNGFQRENRDLWTGQQTYLDMSPMLRADKLQGAILMYHSEEDQNVGTDPISSIRMYQALMGNGKTASLYMYPYEDHGPVARETNLDQWARWVAWLDKYVKGTPVGAQ